MKRSVLIIDDNLSFLKSMQLALNKKNFKCQIAQNIQLAENFLSEKEYDLIICDYFMPEIDGMTVMNDLRNVHKQAVLVLTSSYPLDIEFKKSDRFQFVDKLSLLEWISERYSKFEYA